MPHREQVYGGFMGGDPRQFTPAFEWLRAAQETGELAMLYRSLGRARRLVNHYENEIYALDVEIEKRTVREAPTEGAGDAT